MKAAPTKILLIQGGLGDSVQPALERSGYRVIWVQTAKYALERVNTDTPALVIIDVPSMRVDVGRLCLALKRAKEIPVLLIGEEGKDKCEGMELADGFIPRPLQLRKLLSRVEKMMPAGQSIEFRCGEIVFRPYDGMVRFRGKDHYLNPKLNKLLLTFMQKQGEIIPRKFLMQHVWDTSYMGDTRTLDVHIRWLREAIEDDPSHPIFLKTVRGQGYRFDNPKKK
jgi:DNA-binding response OmpR family regulator